MKDIKRNIRETWDRGAPTYDLHYGHGLKSEAEREAWRKLVRDLLPPEAPLRVLDTGTGTGFLAMLLAELGHKVTGVDLSEGMLEVARTKARQGGLQIDFRQGDAESLPFESGRFDVVVSRHLLWTLLEPAKAIAEWARVTRRGGRVIAIDVFALERRPLDWLVAGLSRGIRLIERPESGEDHAYSPEIRTQLPLMWQTSPQPSQDLFTRAGLHVLQLGTLDWLDAIEQRAMPLSKRLSYRFRRYLIEGKKLKLSE